MSARILAFRPHALVQAELPSADPMEVLCYLKGVEAGDRHGYARGRREAFTDFWRAVSGYWTVPLRRRRVR